MQEFYELMYEVLDLLRYKWTIWGYSFSLLEVWFTIALFQLGFSFILQIFGQVPSALHGSSESNYNGSGINNGKGGSHHYGNRKG